MEHLYLIFETDTTPEYQYELLEQSLAPVTKKPKVKIKTVLQTADVVNKNRRVYKAHLLERGISEIKPIVVERRLVGELDHPVPTGNTTTDTYRHMVVLYKEASHIITDVNMNNGVIYGTVETTQTDNGFNMAGLILDGVKVGFSLRGVGKLVPKPGGILEAADPFHIITYDCVSNPSHKNAKMIEITSTFNNTPVSESDTNLLEGVVLDRSYVLYNLDKGENVDKQNVETLVENLLKVLHTKDNKLIEDKLDQIIQAYLLTEDDDIDRDLNNLLDEYVNQRVKKLDELVEYYLSS